MAKQIDLSAKIIVPDDATEEQVREWVLYNLHCLGGISSDNPLSDVDLEAVSSVDVTIN